MRNTELMLLHRKGDDEAQADAAIYEAAVRKIEKIMHPQYGPSALAGRDDTPIYDLHQRLVSQDAYIPSVSWGPDGDLLSPQDKAQYLNQALSAIENGDYEEVFCIDERVIDKVDVRKSKDLDRMPVDKFLRWLDR